MKLVTPERVAAGAILFSAVCCLGADQELGEKSRDGSSRKNAIVISSSSRSKSTQEEYAYIKSLYPRANVLSSEQRAYFEQGRWYDLQRFTTSNRKMVLYFDVTASNKKRPIAVKGHIFVSTPRPRYPFEARHNHWTGALLAELHVTADGAVDDVKIIKGTGHLLLDEEGRRAFRAWRFRPEGKSFTTKIPLSFTMSENL
jgi:TonB family protein